MAAGPKPARRRTRRAPQLNVLAQYVKDLSFENPNAPRSLQQQQAQPQINIQINVNAKPLADNDYEVDLKIEGRAEVPEPADVQLRAAVRRRVPDRERAAGKPARDHHDRVPAAVVPVRARADRDCGAQWRLPAADDRSGRFRLALPAEDGANAGAAGSAALRVKHRPADSPARSACRRASPRRRGGRRVPPR